jgi:hypothetical protein
MNPHPKWSPRVDQVLAHLKAHGPMHNLRLAMNLGISEAYARMIFSRLLNEEPRRVHIVDWQREIIRQIPYPRAIVAFGPGEDAPKPPSAYATKRAEQRKRAAARKRAAKRKAKLARKVKVAGLAIPVIKKPAPPKPPKPAVLQSVTELRAVSSIFNLAQAIGKKG